MNFLKKMIAATLVTLLLISALPLHAMAADSGGIKSGVAFVNAGSLRHRIDYIGLCNTKRSCNLARKIWQLVSCVVQSARRLYARQLSKLHNRRKCGTRLR